MSKRFFPGGRVDALAAAAAKVAQQHGFITLQQALATGLSRHAVSRLVAEGHWIRVARGLYRLNGVPHTNSRPLRRQPERRYPGPGI